jgi:hypothetical protein
MIAITSISAFCFVSCLVEFSLIQTENAVASAPTRSSHSKTSRDERTLAIGKGAHSWSSAMTKRATKIAASLINDPAVKAWRLVQEAGEDDSAYDEAIDMFEQARVTSPVGLKLKQKLLQMRRADLSDGGTLNWSGRIRMQALERSIDQGIDYLARHKRRA